MKYFMDTEFLEGTQKRRIGNMALPKIFDTKNTIDLISIGIVSEEGREYYAISKDFNLREAWNRFEWELEKPEDSRQRKFKNYWIRENVLKPIYFDLLKMGNIYGDERNYWSFTYKHLKRLLKWYGKTNKQIAEEIKNFCTPIPMYKDGRCNCSQGQNICPNGRVGSMPRCLLEELPINKPKFYGYYADYDWVVFCWLFGKMIDLNKDFTMYCKDLKQELDNKLNNKILPVRGIFVNPNKSLKSKIKEIEGYPNYPKQTNKHNALEDARWNKELYNFLKSL